MSQKEDVLWHLKTQGNITPLEALSLYGCARLAARIQELRRDGEKIHTGIIEVQGWRRPARIARYWI